MSYNLFLDDLREVSDVTWLKLPSVAWTIARSYEDFVDIITADGLPKIVTFDHDLAEEHYNECMWAHDEKNMNRGTFRYDKMKIKTGFHCVQWLVKYCQDKNLPFPQYYVHTMNPIGKDNIIIYIESHKLILA